MHMVMRQSRQRSDAMPHGRLSYSQGASVMIKNINTNLLYYAILVSSIAFCSAGAASAATVSTFSSLSTWQAATSGHRYFLESFTSFAKDAPFRSSILKLKTFSLQQTSRSSYGNFRNFIDHAPFQFADNNKKTHAALYTKYGATTVTITLGSPIYAWSATFFGAQTSELVDIILIDSTGATIGTVPVGTNTGFFGFATNPPTAISKIKFQSRLANPATGVGQGFSIIDVRGAYL